MAAEEHQMEPIVILTILNFFIFRADLSSLAAARQEATHAPPLRSNCALKVPHGWEFNACFLILQFSYNNTVNKLLY